MNIARKTSHKGANTAIKRANNALQWVSPKITVNQCHWTLMQKNAIVTLVAFAFNKVSVCLWIILWTESLKDVPKTDKTQIADTH